MRSWAYNRFGVLMGASWLASGLRWPSLRVDVVPMITLFPAQGYCCATAIHHMVNNALEAILNYGPFAVEVWRFYRKRPFHYRPKPCRCYERGFRSEVSPLRTWLLRVSGGSLYSSCGDD